MEAYILKLIWLFVLLENLSFELADCFDDYLAMETYVFNFISLLGSFQPQLSCLFVSLFFVDCFIQTPFLSIESAPYYLVGQMNYDKKIYGSFMVFILLCSDNIHVRNPSKMEYLLRKRNLSNLSFVVSFGVSDYIIFRLLLKLFDRFLV
ncbi:hypothetical protein AAC387_Pa03g2033 [Persea americana]